MEGFIAYKPPKQEQLDDEVTQYEAVLSCSRISEQFLIPVLTEMLETFPFNISGFHADNGSEYINHRVAKLLNKLHIGLTKSRSRQSNDNALAKVKMLLCS